MPVFHVPCHPFSPPPPHTSSPPPGRSNDDQVTPPTMGKLTPDLLMGNHYEADISDQSDGCLGIPQG